MKWWEQDWKEEITLVVLGLFGVLAITVLEAPIAEKIALSISSGLLGYLVRGVKNGER